MMEKLVSISPVLINFVVTLISILATYEISKKSIGENRKINEENAGKNRIIYASEEIKIDIKKEDSFKLLNEKLSTGNYAILSAVQDRDNLTYRLFFLGKIKP